MGARGRACALVVFLALVVPSGFAASSTVVHEEEFSDTMIVGAGTDIGPRAAHTYTAWNWPNGTLEIPDHAARVVVEVDVEERAQAPVEYELRLCEDRCRTSKTDEAMDFGEAGRVLAKTVDRPPLAANVTLGDVEGPLHWKLIVPRGGQANLTMHGTARFHAPAPSQAQAEPTATTAVPSPSTDGLGLAEAGRGVAATLLLAAGWLAWKRLLPLLGLYHRIDDDELLNHPLRQAIVDAVGEDPGLHFRALMRGLDVGRGALQHHIDRLEDAGILSSVSTDGYQCYYLTGQLEADIVQVLGDLRAQTARDLASLLQDGSVASVRAAADALDVHESTAAYHVSRLEETGVLETTDTGAGRRLSLSELGRRVCQALDLGDR